MLDHPSPSVSLKGQSGRLLQAGRIVARLGAWSAVNLPGRRRLRVSAARFEPHPVLFGHARSREFAAELDLGRVMWRGVATVDGTAPLVLTLEEATCD